MAVPVHPTINDQLTRVQLRLLKQRLEKERAETDSGLTQAARTSQPILDEKYKHLKEAAFQRKELLDRLKHEQQLSRQLLRPRSNPSEELAPKHRPSRRTESQPQFTDSRRNGEMIQHSVRLQPLEYASVPPGPPPAPFLPHVSVPLHVVQPYQMVSGPQMFSQQQPSNNSRSEMYEMMMMQNAQMHQMIMQQLMLNSIQPRNGHSNPSNSSGSNDRMLSLNLDDIRKLLKTPRDHHRPPAYPDYRHTVPYSMSTGFPAITPVYHRPLEPIPMPAVMIPGNAQVTTHISAPEISHLQANYHRQQNETEEESPT